jgi:tetratricopeptide (TPR) repeat protein
VEQASARTQAQKAASRASESERLLVRWFAGVQENDYIPAIMAMNDLLGRYPQDKRLAFLAGSWLEHEGQYEQAIFVLEKALTLDPNYAAALNLLGYAYAYRDDFDKAIAAMDRYVALLPDQPNPHDSYGEILRMAGKFDAALEQYRMSIRVDPNFGSELGVADTLAVMGKEEDAREEYARAIVFVGTESERVDYELQSAVTWIRENNRKQAERALREVAKHAHAAELTRPEAEAHRILAMYDPNYKVAMKELQAADNALAERNPLSASDRADEEARILRVRAVRSADSQAMDIASAALMQLQTAAQNSRSQILQLSYHAAAGAVLMAQQRYAEAISELEEDSSDPLSMRLLWQACNRTGATAEAERWAAKLVTLNVPTVEQALVVPQFRSSPVSQAGQP